MSLSKSPSQAPVQPKGSNEARLSASKVPSPKDLDEPKKGSGGSITNIRASTASGKRYSGGSYSTQRSIDQPKAARSSKLRSFQLDLPPCQIYRTRSSLDHIKNPIDEPKQPAKYNAPFRRNFRYFGYPQDLNLDIDTPPRVKSWGSNPEIVPKSNKHKRRVSSKLDCSTNQGDSFDPHWMGRLLKSNLLLENPGLIPATDKAAINLGSKSKVQLIHPDFEVGNCPSDLYFPIMDKSRKAFCRINKMVQDKIDRRVHAYSVQNPTVMKFMASGAVMKKDEKERRKSMHVNARSSQGLSSQQPRRSAYTLSVAEKPPTSSERLLYDYDTDTNTMSPVVKTLCVDKNYPGMNRQLYQRPSDSDEFKDVKTGSEDDTLILRGPILPEFAMSIPEDVWLKLAKVRQRQQQMENNLKARLETKDPDLGKFRTFTQPELRDEVMHRAREDFMQNLKEDLDAPLPPELFLDNRGLYQPYHDFYGKGELPAQGPFWWKTPKEDPPTEEEMEIVEGFVQEAKDKKFYTHHLPGLLYTPRHPFQPLELDWIEKGVEVGKVREPRKTPSELHEMPAHIMHLDSEEFQEKFNRVLNEDAKDLVGPEIFQLYKRTYGIKDEAADVEEKKSVTEEIPVKAVAVRRVRRKKRISSLRKSKRPTVDEEVEDLEKEMEVEEDEDEEEEDEYLDEEEEEEDVEQAIMTSPPVELEPEYRLSFDLLEDEQFPLPDVRFSLIEFPKGNIPEGAKDHLKTFKSNVENADPNKSDEDEPKLKDNSEASTDSDEAKEELLPEFSHDSVSHLQVMYQSAVKLKHRKSHRPVKPHELEPPKLKDIFLMETYTEDIDHLLFHSDNIPKFLQLF